MSGVPPPLASVERPLSPLRALYCELGQALADAGRHADAVVALEQALHEPGDVPALADIWYWLAFARVDAGDLDGALDVGLRSLLSGHTVDAGRLIEQARGLVSSVHLMTHGPLLQDERWRVLAEDPALPARARADVAVLVGSALLEINEPSVAEPLLTEAARLAPEDSAAHHLRGRALEQLGRHGEAISALDVAHDRAVRAGEAVATQAIAVELAEAQLAAGQIERALTSVVDMHVEDSDLRARALLVRAAVLLARGATTDALAASADAVALQPDGANARALQARALIALHRNGEALEVLDEGLRRNPTHKDLRLRRLLAQLEGQTSTDSTDAFARQAGRLGHDVLRACLDEPAWHGRGDDGRALYARAELSRALGDDAGAIVAARRALELGLDENLPTSPEAPVHALLADALLQTGDQEASIEARFDAGVAYGSRKESAVAVRHLETVVASRPDHPRASWFLAENLRLQAEGSPGSQEGDEAKDGGDRERMMSRAESVWDTAAGVLPGQVEPWAFSVRALINEYRVRQGTERRRDLLWHNIIYLERGLLKDSTDMFPWTMLARTYRLLDLDFCARAAIETAFDLSPSDPGVLEEVVIRSVNAGDYAAALDALDSLDALEGGAEEATGQSETDMRQRQAWNLACRAAAAEGLGEYAEAVEHVERALQVFDGEVWIEQIAGHAHRMLGNRSASLSVFESILARLMVAGGEPTEELAEAHFALGHADEALGVLARCILATGRTERDLELFAALCKLLQDNVADGTGAIEASIERGMNRNGFTELRYGLRVVAEEATAIDQEEFRRESARLESIAERRVAEWLVRAGDADTELEAVFDQSAAGSPSAIATAASLARRARERNEWQVAAERYERLGSATADFPDAATALQELIETLERNAHESLSAGDVSAAVEAVEAAVAVSDRMERPHSDIAETRRRFGDALVGAGRSSLARLQYQMALDALGPGDDPAANALLGRLVIAHDLSVPPDPDRTGLATVVRGYATAGAADPGRLLGELARSLVATVRDYSALDASWAEAFEDLATASDVRLALPDARRALAGALDDLLGMAPGFEEHVPIVIPIVVEVGDALVPLVDPNQDAGVFIYELIPAMRNRILASTGVSVPGVRLRGAPVLEENGFCIQVDETPVLRGTLDAAATFEVVDGKHAPAGVSDFHPLTGEPGLWVVRPSTSDDESAGAHLTAAGVLIHTIERVIRRHLGRYLGPQEVAMLVETWGEADHENVIPSVVPDADARLRLTWILQALADDAVPLANWPALLASIRESGGIDQPAATLTPAVRRGLRDQLPGPRTGLAPLHVPDDQEALLRRATAEDELTFLRWVRESCERTGAGVVLITRTSDARERASLLTREGYPTMRTLTREELNTQADMSTRIDVGHE
jgi:tetratricopeptide (TPR) repeat protein